jgi:hypothetical protein
MEAGIALSRWFADETARIYADIGGTGETSDARQSREAQRLVANIRELGGTITPNELRKAQSKIRTNEEAQAALQALVDGELGRWEFVPPGPQGGRPTHRFVLHESPPTKTETPRIPEKTEVSVSVAPADEADSEVCEWTA